MSDPYLSEIRLMAFNYPPKGWATCDGQLLPINQNQALFALLHTMYGGDGRVTFALPDLRSRVPVHLGSGFAAAQGARGGEAAHILTVAELPQHIHLASGTSDAASSPAPAGNLLATVDSTTFGSAYQRGGSPVAMAATAVASVGGSQAHENRQPYLQLNFCIAMQGIFPSAN